MKLLVLPLFSTNVAKGLQDCSIFITSSGSLFLFITSFLFFSRTFFSTGFCSLNFSRSFFFILCSFWILNIHMLSLILSAFFGLLLHNLLDEFVYLQLLLCADPDSLLKCFRGGNKFRKNILLSTSRNLPRMVRVPCRWDLNVIDMSPDKETLIKIQGLALRCFSITSPENVRMLG